MSPEQVWDVHLPEVALQSPSAGDYTVVYCTAKVCWAANAQSLGDGTLVVCTCSVPMAPHWHVLLGGAGWTVLVDHFFRTTNNHRLGIIRKPVAFNACPRAAVRAGQAQQRNKPDLEVGSCRWKRRSNLGVGSRVTSTMVCVTDGANSEARSLEAHGGARSQARVTGTGTRRPEGGTAGRKTRAHPGAEPGQHTARRG